MLPYRHWYLPSSSPEDVLKEVDDDDLIAFSRSPPPSSVPTTPQSGHPTESSHDINNNNVVFTPPYTPTPSGPLYDNIIFTPSPQISFLKPTSYPRTPTPPSRSRDFEDLCDLFTVPSPTPKRLKRRASIPSPSLYSLLHSSSSRSKRRRLTLRKRNKNSHNLFSTDDVTLPSDSDSDRMIVDVKPNTREYRRRMFRSWPGPSVGILEPDEDSFTSLDDMQLLKAVKVSKMYRKSNLILTESELKDISRKALDYKEALRDYGFSKESQETLARRAEEMVQFDLLGNKISEHLKSVGSKLQWTDLGLPTSEVVRASKSMPNIKIVASVQTKEAKPSSSKAVDGMKGQLSQLPKKIIDQKKPRSDTAAADTPYLIRKAQLARINPAAARKEAQEEKEKADIQRMLKIRSTYKITPRAVTPTPGEKPPTEESLLSYDHMKRYNQTFNKDTENSFTRDQKIREQIRHQHAEYNHEAALNRQNDIWYSDPPAPFKLQSWERVPPHRHNFYTFNMEDIIDALPDIRYNMLRHNELVYASGERIGDFEYTRDGPYGRDVHIDDDPLDDC